MIDEFLAKSEIYACSSFMETAEVIGKVAFPMYLGTPAEVVNWNPNNTEFTFVLNENPLAEFVMLPTHLHQTLWYSNLICGVIKGALEMLNINVQCYFKKDKLRGNDSTEIQVVLLEIVKDKYEDEEM